MSNNPLVSIVVVTYNSSEFVLETLESAKIQTYKNIELIVTDDCSKDNTLEIVKDWVDKNKDSFIHTLVLEATVNTGISGNCNRGCNASKGEYIKTIAGDDTLETNAITDLIDYLHINPSVSLVFGQVTIINEKSEKIELVQRKIANRQITFDHEFRSNMIHAPAIFFSRSIYDKVKGFDENLKVEDIDYYLRILANDGIIEYIEKPIAGYRMHSSNISKDSSMMLQEHIKTLDKHKKRKNYQWNYIKFTENVLFKQKIDNRDFKFSKFYKVLSHNHLFVNLIFFDVYFWLKYFFKMKMKNLLKRV